MCSAQYRWNYRNSLTHTLDHPLDVGLEVLALIVALLLKTALIKTIIPLSKKLSIVFCAASKKYCGVKEQRYMLLCNARELGQVLPKRARRRCFKVYR